MLDLRKLTGDGLHKLTLLFKVGVSDQLGVVHLDHLQLLASSMLLLCKRLPFASVSVFNLLNLQKEALFTFSGLLRTHLLNLIC